MSHFSWKWPKFRGFRAILEQIRPEISRFGPKIQDFCRFRAEKDGCRSIKNSSKSSNLPQKSMIFMDFGHNLMENRPFRGKLGCIFLKSGIKQPISRHFYGLHIMKNHRFFMEIGPKWSISSSKWPIMRQKCHQISYL